MRALKKIMAALALTAVLAGCSADNILSSIQGGKAGTVQTVSRPAVESAELQLVIFLFNIIAALIFPTLGVR